MIYVITGTSSGIGLALAQYYLEKGKKVIGISRNNQIAHTNFTFIPCDFTNKEEVQQLSLTKYISKDHLPICLINNAGTIGTIRRTPLLDYKHFEEVALTNIVAPQYLSASILKDFEVGNVEFIINISSGAGQYPVASWSAYCASKAAINLFTETLDKEIKELNGKTRVFAIAPGVVDTTMQNTIRNSKEGEFSRREEFIEKYENQELRSPQEVAERIANFIKNPPAEGEGCIHRI